MESAEDVLCDALLMEVGVGTLTSVAPWKGRLDDAREEVRPWAKAIIESLQDNGYELRQVDGSSE